MNENEKRIFVRNIVIIGVISLAIGYLLGMIFIPKEKHTPTKEPLCTCPEVKPCPPVKPAPQCPGIVPRPIHTPLKKVKQSAGGLTRKQKLKISKEYFKEERK